MAKKEKVDNSEQALIGWQEIAGLFGCCEKTIRSRKSELYDAGVIFYMNHGRPPRRRVCAFPSLLKVWVIRKTMEGETI
jgi:hypothetical protein